MDFQPGALDNISAGLERRIAALGGRVGDHMAQYVGRPGKLLRARYVLLLGSALGVRPDVSESVARAAELVHNASLLHDDCIDEAHMRRGWPTPSSQFGDRTGILLGDLAFTEGMAEAAAVSAEAVRELVRAVHEMTVGEIQEEFVRGSPNVSVEGYYGVAARKTGALFEWIGRALSENSPLEHRREDLPRLGRSAGILLQIVDDIHDYTLGSDVAGKDPGRDFALGRLTLPAILALDDENSRKEFLRIWSSRESGREAFVEARAFLDAGGFLDAAREKARGIMVAMAPLVSELPQKDGARSLRAFMELLFRREF